MYMWIIVRQREDCMPRHRPRREGGGDSGEGAQGHWIAVDAVTANLSWVIRKESLPL